MGERREEERTLRRDIISNVPRAPFNFTRSTDEAFGKEIRPLEPNQIRGEGGIEEEIEKGF